VAARLRRDLLLLAFVAVVVSPSPARAGAPEDYRAVAQGLERAVTLGRLLPEEAVEYRGVAWRAATLTRRLPRVRAASVAAVLGDVARLRGAYDQPRALALFSMLDMNVRYLGTADVPPPGSDVRDADGVVYRAFSGHGLQFHPLANFARLNSLVAGRRLAEADVLAAALLDRAVGSGGGIAWEYYFPFGGGRAPWTSGMAQAVAAQALARADYLEDARRAYVAIPGRLLISLAAGPWARLYSFSSLVVLNAHLQAAISLADYARLARDPGAEDLAARMRASAVALLPRFDTGYWSLYALRGGEAQLGYHRYVVSLLGRLGAQTGEPFWGRWRDRFALYAVQPPLVRPARREPTIVRAPRNLRAVARLSFWLSKLSLVTLNVAGTSQSAWLRQGFHALPWRPGRRPAGSYRASIAAVDLAGNRAFVQLPPVVVERPRPRRR
jgi:D-glucuronyl C5-epimerase C-terminus